MKMFTIDTPINQDAKLTYGCGFSLSGYGDKVVCGFNLEEFIESFPHTEISLKHLCILKKCYMANCGTIESDVKFTSKENQTSNNYRIGYILSAENSEKK